MLNYQNGKIYKITCDESGLTYYGSTTQPLCIRLYQHKKGSKCMTKHMINPKIHLLENFPCNTKEELLKREQWYIKNNKCCNRIIPLRTRKQYSEDNKDKIKEYNKEYREANKDKIAEKKKEYNKEYIKQLPTIKCECGGEYKNKKYNKNKHFLTKKHQAFINS